MIVEETELLVISNIRTEPSLNLEMSYPLLLAPDAEAVGPGGAADARVEEAVPVRAVKLAEGFHVMLDVQQAAGAAPVDDLVEQIGLLGGAAGGDGLEGDVLGGEVVRSRAVAAGLVLDVLIGGAGALEM